MGIGIDTDRHHGSIHSLGKKKSIAMHILQTNTDATSAEERQIDN